MKSWRIATLVACGLASTTPITAQEVATRILAMKPPELIAVLQDAKSSTFDKAKACQRLGVLGAKDATPALAAQLADEQLNDYARTGLEALADPAADAALRDAAAKLSGRQLVGVLNSLGERRDAKAVSLLEEQLKAADKDVQTAAVCALGNIGNDAAAQALAGAVDSEAPGIGNACLECAERLSPGNQAAALDLYRKLSASKAAKSVRLAAALGEVRLDPAMAPAWLVKQLSAADHDEFNLALLAARQLSGKDAAAALVSALPTLSPERQALVLRALGDRREPPPLSLLVAQAKGESDAVRAAAVDVLAKLGTADAASELINVAFSDGQAAPLASKWLSTLKSRVVDDAIAARASSPEAAANPTLIQLIGARRIAKLKAVVLALATNSDPAVRRAALAALGQMGELADLDVVIKQAFAAGSEPDVETAQDALRTAALRLGDRDACAERLAKELPAASEANQAVLLRLLREMGAGSPAALSAVVVAAKSDNANLKDHATRELGQWPTADAAPALADLAKNDADGKYRIRALRGYIRIARQLQLSDDQRVQFFDAAMKLATRDDEKRLALVVLTRAPSPATLDLVVTRLDDAALKDAAAEAAIKIAGALLQSNPPAVAAAMKKVQSAGVAPALATRAAELLNRTGATAK